MERLASSLAMGLLAVLAFVFMIGVSRPLVHGINSCFMNPAASPQKPRSNPPKDSEEAQQAPDESV